MHRKVEIARALMLQTNCNKAKARDIMHAMSGNLKCLVRAKLKEMQDMLKVLSAQRESHKASIEKLALTLRCNKCLHDEACKRQL